MADSFYHCNTAAAATASDFFLSCEELDAILQEAHFASYLSMLPLASAAQDIDSLSLQTESLSIPPSVSASSHEYAEQLSVSDCDFLLHPALLHGLHGPPPRSLTSCVTSCATSSTPSIAPSPLPHDYSEPAAVADFRPMLPAPTPLASPGARPARASKQTRKHSLSDVVDEPRASRKRTHSLSDGFKPVAKSKRARALELMVKRDTHNDSERLRRCEMKDGLLQLKSVLPSVPGMAKMNTGQLLEYAVRYIRQMVVEDERLVAEKLALREHITLRVGRPLDA